MRAILVVVCLLVFAPVAGAETVLVMSDSRGEMESAVRVAMAGRGIAVARAPRPLGALRLERAAMAQRTALEIGASAAVWLDDADVCVVSADGQQFRQAPLPAEVASPRAFAAIATSLLDEIIRPEPGAQGFDVNVNVAITPHAERGALPALAAPGLTDTVQAPQERAHQGDTLFEIGAMVTPLSAGPQAGISIPVSEAYRIAANGALTQSWVDGGFSLVVASVEIRHVGRGRKHWDIGPEAGYATAEGDPAVFAGLRVARTWEGPGAEVSLAFTPLALAPLDGTGAVIPGIFTTLKWQLAL